MPGSKSKIWSSVQDWKVRIIRRPSAIQDVERIIEEGTRGLVAVRRSMLRRRQAANVVCVYPAGAASAPAQGLAALRSEADPGQPGEAARAKVFLDSHL